jgi:hypothetical protein
MAIMERERTREILQAYRPDSGDEQDPVFTEALQMARRQPDLARELAALAAFDARARAALQAVAPPTDLRARILAAHTARRFTPSVWLALAAGLALAIGAFFWLPRPAFPSAPLTTAEFTRNALGVIANGGWEFGQASSQPADLQPWLAAHGAPHHFQIPKGLQGIRSLGCQRFSFQGTTATLICFTLDQDHTVHLFVVDAKGLRDAPPAGAPSTAQSGNVATIAWSQNGQTFLLVAPDLDSRTLRSLI